MLNWLTLQASPYCSSPSPMVQLIQGESLLPSNNKKVHGVGNMDHRKLAKPEHLAEDTWEQHLDWMGVMGKQVEENFTKHQVRVQEDASRNEALSGHHEQALQGQRRVRSLFCE
jgi:hypothetical protein